MGRLAAGLGLLLLACGLAAPAPAGAAVSPELRRYPYLTDLVGSAATVNFATDRSAASAEVRWGRPGSESCDAPPHAVPAVRTDVTVNSVPEYQWKTLLDLSPRTRYCYRVYSGPSATTDLLGTDPSPQFDTQVPAGSPTPFSFAVFGDWGDMDRVPHQENVLSQLAASPTEFAVTVGDNTYNDGTQTNQGDLVQRGFKVSGVFAPEFWKKVGASRALFQAVGNHDVDEGNLVLPSGFGDCTDPSNSAVSALLVNWPQDRAVSGSGGRYCTETYSGAGTSAEEYPSAWYAFDVGVARFYVLQAAWTRLNRNPSRSVYRTDFDYHWDPASAFGRRQYEWLANDLATHPRALKFAFFHYPLHSDSPADGSDTELQGPGRLEGLLQNNGVDMVFNGHAHNYQRNLPDAAGMVSYVTGGAGAGNMTIGPPCSASDAYGLGWNHASVPERGSACGAAPVPTAADQTYHFLLVSVNGTRVTVTPTDELGRVFDAVTYDFPAVGAAAVAPAGARPRDRTAPVQRLRARSPQDVDRLFVIDRVNEPSRLTARAYVNLSGSSRVVRFRTRRRSVGAGKRTRIRLKLAKRNLRLIKRRLRRGSRVRARVRVTARDASGNTSHARVTIRLRP
jgi:calcineurin-like phosphoesterase family protein